VVVEERREEIGWRGGGCRREERGNRLERGVVVEERREEIGWRKGGLMIRT
jgi:hypothetical protein